MEGPDLTKLRNDVAVLVEQAMASDRTVNVPVIAEKLRRLHEHLNIALEDIEALVLQSAQIYTFPIEFDKASSDQYEDHC